MTNLITTITQPSTGGKLFLLLFSLAFLGVLAVLPYNLALNPLPKELPVSPVVAIVASVAQGAVLVAIATGLGLFLARRAGLGLPLIEAWISGDSLPSGWLRQLLLAAGLGAAAGALILLLEQVFFGPRLAEVAAAAGAALPEALQPTAWKGALAAFYGGITEEVLLRLFLFSLIAWLGARVDATAAGLPTLRVLWLAALLAAIVFGLGHLPATRALGLPLNGLVVARAIVLNGVVGLLAGWLYFTRGLESAMAAHFAADVVLHVLFPLLKG
jgi:hypothetical protein